MVAHRRGRDDAAPGLAPGAPLFEVTRADGHQMLDTDCTPEPTRKAVVLVTGGSSAAA